MLEQSLLNFFQNFSFFFQYVIVFCYCLTKSSNLKRLVNRKKSFFENFQFKYISAEKSDFLKIFVPLFVQQYPLMNMHFFPLTLFRGRGTNLNISNKIRLKLSTFNFTILHIICENQGYLAPPMQILEPFPEEDTQMYQFEPCKIAKLLDILLFLFKPLVFHKISMCILITETLKC